MEPTLTPDQAATLSRLSQEDDLAVDLDAQLDALQAELEPEPEVEMAEEVTVPSLRDDVLGLLRLRKDRPDEEDIQAWKNKYGDEAVQIFGVDKDNVFIYTHITLGQWEKIQSILQSLQPGTPQAVNAEKTIRENVIRSAVLWPELDKDFFRTCRAGIPSSLYDLIMMHSYFLTPQQAISLSTQL